MADEGPSASADTASPTPKPPTRFTVAANSAAAISFDDPGDFDRATRGLIAQLNGGRVTWGRHLVFDVARHAFVAESEQAPPSVHPGLWRQARLNVNHGLFEVAEGVWQVRGYDLANITFVARFAVRRPATRSLGASTSRRPSTCGPTGPT